ncbi:gluconate 2-dehydrogenase subunit 3 family protein [Microvirga sp. SRT01]|jgi:gluconate 2-dehydrogenase gamma chain|uniref:Gluconate 2-dehydrogenase subunit 3 family protein n=1 Tax=Sphingomonas longa TaxID=2778730 RepID=A0ABS2DBC2_9SPHN|nr:MULTISPECIES: gluconate 2-dehydrogenase subunit 3 family protein [Alphaproteobacteria]MBM6578203.1 gluconate 2-dehydrogenase subunit 3 family protein [Sphingomonas sp. BT552]MBR7711244.1 gluconate 2-dehydrogenase subunit 3 family protein [Microvirga sp. SRT01]
MIDRRTALAGAVAMFGSALFAPIARAAGASLVAKMPVINDGPPTTAIFTAPQRALMTALSERVMPTTDTPGAITAGVPAFIEKLLADWASPNDKVPIVAGLDAIEARSMKDYKVSGSKATPAQQDALLTLAMNDQIPGGANFFEPFRQLVIVGYFTSEVGITQEREYLPVPGEYNGEFLYSKVNKVYSS